MLAVDDDNTVRITHYVNPHCFWYKPETAYIPHHEQGLFCAEFNEHCERVFGCRDQTVRSAWNKQNKKPEVGDLVAYRTQLGRWVRCKVEEIVTNLSGLVWYQLWAMDEGLPIKSVRNQVWPLPDAYIGEPAHAKRGALMNILPGETRYDYVQGKNILEPCHRWCPGIVSTLQTLLDNAVSVSMVEKAHLPMENMEVVHFGDILIKAHCSASFNIVDLLRNACSDQMLISPDAEFLKVVHSLQCFNMKRYKNNEGIDNVAIEINRTKTNRDESLEPAMPCATNASEADANVQQKVSDWFLRNMKATSAGQEFKEERDKIVPPMHSVPEGTK